MNVTIRPTTAADVPALSALVAAVARERTYLYATDGFTVEQTGDYLSAVQATGGVALVAIEDDAIVGWIDLMPGSFEGLRHQGRFGMGVAAHARGRGVGAALLQAAMRLGFERFERLELEVFASNVRAHALYRRFGFVEEGRRRRARHLDGTYDDIIMLGLLREEWAG